MLLCQSFTCMHVVLLTQEPAFWRRPWMHCTLFTSRRCTLYIKQCSSSLTYSNLEYRADELRETDVEWVSKTDTDEKKLLNKVITFVFFVHKKYSRSFIKWMLTILKLSYLSGPWMCQLRCGLCRVKKLSDFIKNILICALKMNEGLTGLERHEGE